MNSNISLVLCEPKQAVNTALIAHHPRSRNLHLDFAWYSAVHRHDRPTRPTPAPPPSVSRFALRVYHTVKVVFLPLPQVRSHSLALHPLLAIGTQPHEPTGALRPLAHPTGDKYQEHIDFVRMSSKGIARILKYPRKAAPCLLNFLVRSGENPHLARILLLLCYRGAVGNDNMNVYG